MPELTMVVVSVEDHPTILETYTRDIMLPIPRIGELVIVLGKPYKVVHSIMDLDEGKLYIQVVTYGKVGLPT